MADPQTLCFPIKISYKGADDSEQVQSFTLTLSLSLEAGVQNSTCGEFTLNGAVMPVEDPKGGAPLPEVNPDQDGLSEAA